MGKINKEIVIFITFLILVVLVGLFIKTPVDTKMPVDTKIPVQGKKVAGFFIEFEEGATQPEFKALID